MLGNILDVSGIPYGIELLMDRKLWKEFGCNYGIYGMLRSNQSA